MHGPDAAKSGVIAPRRSPVQVLRDVPIDVKRVLVGI
jgi:hypothetical protein